MLTSDLSLHIQTLYPLKPKVILNAVDGSTLFAMVIFTSTFFFHCLVPSYIIISSN